MKKVKVNVDIQDIQNILKKLRTTNHIVASLSGDNIQVTIQDVHFFGSREKLLSQLARISSHFNSLMEDK